MKWFWLFGLLVISVFIMGCASGSGSVQETPAAPETATRTSMSSNGITQPTATNAPNPKVEKNIEDAQIGTPYEISYLSSKYAVTLEKTAYETSSFMGKRYLMAFFKIKNTGDGSEYFAPDIYAVDSDSEKYDKTFAVGLSSDYDKMLDFLKKLTPNTQMSGWVAINVPDDVNEFDLYFEYTNTFIDRTPRYINYKIK